MEYFRNFFPMLMGSISISKTLDLKFSLILKLVTWQPRFQVFVLLISIKNLVWKSTFSSYIIFVFSLLLLQQWIQLQSQKIDSWYPSNMFIQLHNHTIVLFIMFGKKVTDLAFWKKFLVAKYGSFLPQVNFGT